MEKELKEGMAPGIGRRTFVKRAGLTGLGLAGASLMAGRLDLMEKVEAATITDNDILNFALNLEYLEAEFYTVATTGRRISDFGIPITGVGDPGRTEGGFKVDFGTEGAGAHDRREDPLEYSRRLREIAKEITHDEQQHVLVLRGALGPDAIAKPEINLDALGIGFSDFQSFLTLSRAFEDTGVSAYGGALPLITSKTYLSVGGRIGLTEALHSANIRLLVAENKIRTAALDKKDVLPPPSGGQYFEVDSNALTIVRTPSEVLAIVFNNHTPGTKQGGFFPDGVNGKINTV